MFDDTVPPQCADCNRPIHNLGDHAADLRKKGLGWDNPHNVVVKVLINNC